MSRNRDNNDSQAGNMATVAAVAAAGALVVGVMSALGSLWAEDSRQTEGPSRHANEPTIRESSTDVQNRANSSQAVYQRKRPTNEVKNEEELVAWLRREQMVNGGDVISESEELCCKICLDRRISHVLQCGHTLCRQCAVNIVASPGRLCPFDRNPVIAPPTKLYM